MNPSGQPFGAPPPSAAPRNEQVSLAAILLMVAAGLALAYSLVSLVSSGAGGDGSWALNLVKDEALREKMREAMAKSSGGGSRVAGMLWPLIMIAANAFIIFAGTKMKNFEAYNLSMAAAVLATIPCCFNGCCCITSMPVGIFALVLLMKPEVKASFTS
jgi:hypothetical protein